MRFIDKVLKVMKNPSTWPFLGLGLASQAPANLVGGTLKAWLATENVDLTQIGLFSLVMLPYSVKFLWAPFVDRTDLPLARKLGRKKTWGLLCQLGVMALLFALSAVSPENQLMIMFALCMGITLFTATQDIAIDALRIDTLSGDALKQGTALYQVGARIGMLSAVAGMIFLSNYVAWSVAYKLSIGLVFIGFVSLLCIKEKSLPKESVSFQKWVVDPLKDLMSRSNFLILCLFILFYRLCNSMLDPMAYPFYFDIGFTKSQVSLVSGTFGVFVTMFGVFLGGLALMKYQYRPLLLWLGSLEILTSLAFAALATVGPDMTTFFAVILFDNILAGMGGAVWVVYLSNFCSRTYSGTQYALLSAIYALDRFCFASASGWLAKTMGWAPFFVLTGLLMIPALVMIHQNKIGLRHGQPALEKE